MPDANERGAAPWPPARVPNRNRHILTRVRRSTRRKNRNAVVDPTVDLQADIDVINSGRATRSGNLWDVSGRTYHVDATGHAWPVSGAGVYSLDRGAFLALGIYNELGLTEMAESLLDYEGVVETARAEARRVWQAGREAS